MATPNTAQIITSSAAGALSEAEITRRWSSLTWEIKQWVHRHEKSASITSSDQQTSSLTLQAIIWRTLIQHLLSTASNPHGKISWDVNSGIVKDQSNKAQFFSKVNPSWVTSSTSVTLDNTMTMIPFNPNKTQIDQKITQLRTLTRDEINIRTDDKLAIRGLDDIFRKAVQFQIDLALQSAWWYCEYPVADTHGKIQFDSETMITTNQEVKVGKGKTVVLVVSPAFIRRGDAEGKDGNAIKVIEKGMVVCGKPGGTKVTMVVRKRAVMPGGFSLWEGGQKSDDDEENFEGNKVDELPKRRFTSWLDWLF
ncbi:hypothetical protein QBC38DRAFT_528153 [Podospora fimiseda]|uniref:Uncharacterized protein n=1 Tax=Podospora fimiseda TaxID=252190 RepID=A0AAN7BNR4_9PEZI|nr:hypothetical protein QBC38DRAFT_528153 [Podospora fimiseda]